MKSVKLLKSDFAIVHELGSSIPDLETRFSLLQIDIETIEALQILECKTELERKEEVQLVREIATNRFEKNTAELLISALGYYSLPLETRGQNELSLIPEAAKALLTRYYQLFGSFETDQLKDQLARLLGINNADTI